jgi:hypothetical protein
LLSMPGARGESNRIDFCKSNNSNGMDVRYPLERAQHVAPLRVRVRFLRYLAPRIRICGTCTPGTARQGKCSPNEVRCKCVAAHQVGPLSPKIRGTSERG